MTVVRFECNITDLAPEEPREVIHTVEGALLRAEILEANSRHFRARILEPFEQVIEKTMPLFMLYMTNFTFVREGRRTSILLKFIQEAMESAFHEWQRREGEKERFLADRDSLEPLIVQAHQEAAEVIQDLEGVGKDLQSLGEALNSELCRLRGGLRNQLKSGAIDQKTFQARLKALREKGPETEVAASLLTEAGRLQRRLRTLRELLKETVDSSSQRAGIDLGHAVSLAGLEELQLNDKYWDDSIYRLKDLSLDVHSLLRVTL